MAIYVIDTETTAGFKQENIQFAMIGYENDTLSTVIKRKILYTLPPTEKILPAAIAVHGITLRKLQQKTPLCEYDIYLKTIHSFLSNLTENDWLVGYNHIDFDIRYLQTNFVEHGLSEVNIKANILDVITLARKMFQPSEIGGYTLNAVYCMLANDNEDTINKLFQIRSTHDALIDVKLTAWILKRMMKHLNKTTLIEMLDYLSLPTLIEEIPFGKYKGSLITDILESDAQYLRWISREPTMKTKYPDLVYTIGKVLTSDIEYKNSLDRQTYNPVNID